MSRFFKYLSGNSYKNGVKLFDILCKIWYNKNRNTFEPIKCAQRKGGNDMKHFIEIMYPSIFHATYSEEEIEERNPKSVKLPDGAEGFRFFDKNEEEEKVNYTGWYYVGRKYTVEEVESMFSEEERGHLARNMRRNGWTYIVKTCENSCYPFREDDKILAEL